MQSYPEHEKLQAVKAESQICGEFMDWLQQKQGIVFRRWVEYTESESGYQYDRPRSALTPVRESIQELLAEFFGINAKRLEAEKREMLAAAREGHPEGVAHG